MEENLKRQFKEAFENFKCNRHKQKFEYEINGDSVIISKSCGNIDCAKEAEFIMDEIFTGKYQSRQGR
jgi:hypothetical protein